MLAAFGMQPAPKANCNLADEPMEPMDGWLRETYETTQQVLKVN